MATSHGAPSGSAHVDDRIGALDKASRADFAAWVLAEWIRYDTQPYPEDKAAEVCEAALEESYETYTMFWEVRETLMNERYHPEYDRDTPMARKEWAEYDREQITHRANMFINWKPYLFSAIAAKGLLAIARHAPPDVLTREISGYMSGHGKRMAQCKALLDCLFAAGHADAIKTLMTTADTQKQKGLRIYAANLLGSA